MRLKPLILTIASALIPCAASAAPERLALVIGNGEYSRAEPLDNPPSDARKLTAALKMLGFDVELETNLDQTHLASVVRAFGAKLKTKGPNTVSFFYYAGHAAQDAARTNYLLPIDATAAGPEAVRRQATPVQAILDDMEAANNDVNILVIDACRDWFKKDRRPSFGRGLHDMGRHGNVLIALATSPDTTAEEGTSDSSPYTARLLTALGAQAADPLALMFDDVDAKVYNDTDRAQAPEYLNGLDRAPRWSLAGNGTSSAAVAPPHTLLRTSAFLKGLDRDRLLAFAGGNVAFVDSLLSRRDLLSQNGIDTPLRLAHFLTLIAWDTANFRAQNETLNFPAHHLKANYPQKFPTLESTADYAGHPERIANFIYANRIGNGDEASGDGWRYRGRGLLLLTGRANYKSMGDAIGVDLIGSPDLVSDPEVGLAVAATFWSRRQVAPLADADNLLGVTKKFHGIALALAARGAILEKAKAAVATASVAATSISPN